MNKPKPRAFPLEPSQRVRFKNGWRTDDCVFIKVDEMPLVGRIYRFKYDNGDTLSVPENRMPKSMRIKAGES